jgi:PleD family two-component response regulator
MQDDPNKESLSTNKRYKILLVDDEDFNHEILDLSLNKTEFSLVKAKSVEAAMRIIAADPPDILITDAMMPGESGFSLIEKIRSSPATASVPIILWTSLEQPDGSVMDASRKADFTVSKPFYLSSILETLEKAKQLFEERATTQKGDDPDNTVRFTI